MKVHINLLFALSALLAMSFTSCSRDDSGETPTPQEVELLVTLEGEPETKVNLAGSAFENGDQFRFFFNSAVPTAGADANTGGDTDVKITGYTYRSATKVWETLLPIYWDDHLARERDFCAVSPFDLYTVSGHRFSVNADQSANVSNYKSSDLLVARVKTDARRIPLEFHHALSRVIVDVTASTDDTKPEGWFAPTALAGLKATLNDVQTGAEITYHALTLNNTDPAISSTAVGSQADVKMYCTKAPLYEEAKKTITATFLAILPPQTFGAGTTLVTFDLGTGTDKKTYYFSVPAGKTATFSQGNATRISVRLTKSKVELAGGSEDIKITPWGEIDVDVTDPIEIK